MTQQHPSIRPLAPACGAEVVGIDLADPSESTMAQLRDALAQHAVVFCRDQHLSPAQQVELTRRFGQVLRVPYIRHLDAHPDIIAVLKEALPQVKQPADREKLEADMAEFQKGSIGSK